MQNEKPMLGFWTIGKKLCAGFTVILILLAIISTVAFLQFSSVGKTIDQIVNTEWKKTQAVASMVEILGENTIYTIIQASSEAKDRAEWRNKIIGNRGNFLASSKFLQENIVSKKGLETLAELEIQRGNYVKSQNKFYELLDANSNEAALKELLTVTLPILTDVKNTLASIEKMAVDNAELHSVSALKNIYSSGLTIIGIAFLAFLFGALVAWRITLSITKPISDAVVLAQEVATGNLTHKVVISTKDETGQLLTSLGKMNDGLIAIVNDVRESSASIATATAQIASGNTDLSSRTEEQASALEQTAAAMQQIMSAVEQNLANTRQAHASAEATTQEVESGGAVVAQAVESMQMVKAAGEKITDIVGMIESIAFQTNILALNAAVEAARAGDQGRGFAVVATEVRALAGRSATASKEIKSLIQSSVEHIAKSSDLVERTGQTMQSVLSSVRNVTSLVSEVAHSSQEQTASLEQINSAVTQMDTVTQQNAALVEEGAAAAQSLQSQAQGLVQTVGVFNTASSMSWIEPSAIGAKPVTLNPESMRTTGRVQRPLNTPALA